MQLVHQPSLRFLRVTSCYRRPPQGTIKHHEDTLTMSPITRPASALPGPESPPLQGLSTTELDHLAGLETKLQLARDYVGEVVHGYTTGLYLYGEGGIGKSFTVFQELDRLNADYKPFNSRMTGRGLFNALEKFPDSIHVLEDMEQIMHDRGAQGVLRSALWGQRKVESGGRMERPVTWSTYKKEHTFIFTGGIILISNRPLADLPELQALKTRIACLHLAATDSQLIALMRSVSMKGFRHLDQSMTPAECLSVCEFIIKESRSLHRSLDMRLLVNAFADYLAWQEGDAGCHWKDMVASRLKERPTTFEVKPDLGTRADRKRRDQEIAREIAESTDNRMERARLWAARTGKSEPTLYRRLADLDRM